MDRIPVIFGGWYLRCLRATSKIGLYSTVQYSTLFIPCGSVGPFEFRSGSYMYTRELSGVAMSYPICDYACFVRPSHALALGMYGFRARARAARR